MLQGTLFAPESAWRPPNLADLPQDWNAYDRVAIDCETCDPTLKKLGPGVRRGSYVTGVALGFGMQEGYYLPVRHLGGDNMDDPEQVWAYLRYQAKHFRGEVVGAKISYDIDFLAQAGVEFGPDVLFRDVQVAEPLINELHKSYSLNSCLARHDLPLKDESLLREAASAYRIDPKAEMWKLPARYVGAYAEGDVTLPLQLLRRQEQILVDR